MLKVNTLARIVICLLSTGILLQPSQATASNKGLAIPTAGLHLVPKAQYINHAHLDKRIYFDVHLKIRNKEKLDVLFQQIYDPKSPRYQNYLSSEEYKRDFAADTKTLALVKNYFTDAGMQAKIVGDEIQVSATVAQIEQQFKIQINNYRYQNKKFYANTSPPLVDQSIAIYLSDISGLNSFPRFHSMMHRTPPLKKRILQPRASKANQKTLQNLSWGSFTPTAMPTDNSFNGFTGKNLRKTYKLDRIAPINGSAIDGFGQTVIILDGCGTNDPLQILADANQYSTHNGLPLLEMTNSGPGQDHKPYFSVVDKLGNPISSCSPQGDWAGEIALDIAAVHTIAPYANIVLVLDNGLNIGTLVDNIVTTPSGNTFAQFPNTNVISNSWGENEDDEPFLEIKLQHAATRGISVNFASSDCGDQTYTNGFWPCKKAGNNASVEYPASSTYTTAVGGTSLFVDQNWNYSFETGWGSYSVNGIQHFPFGFLAGSTGGISRIYAAPSWQQNHTFQSFIAGGYGVISSYFGGNMRAIPDVAMLADLFTGLIVYEHGGCENGCINGGTSLSTPLFSGTLALINQARALQSKPTIGLAASYLYNANQNLSQSLALNFVAPPHRIIDKTESNPPGAPLDTFTLVDNSYWYNTTITFNWDSSLTLDEFQYWNDVVGVGTPYLPNFVMVMASL